MPDDLQATPELIRMAQQAKAEYDAKENGSECKHSPTGIKKKKLRVTAECSLCGSDLLFVKGGGPLPTMWMAVNNLFNKR